MRLLKVWALLQFTLTPAIAMAASPPTEKSDATISPQHRIALVVANFDYEYAPALPGVRRDAERVVDSLEASGFQVNLEENLGKRDLQAELARIANKDGRDSIILIYYSGHGIQYRGENYIVPVDAALPDVESLPSQAVSLSAIMDAMRQSEAPTNIVILDACRTNPWANGWSETDKAAAPVGLGDVNAPTSFLVAFATAPGTAALDGGSGRAGPYADALATEVLVGGDQFDVFNQVSLRVRDATDARQQPWFSTNGQERFEFDADAPSPTRTVGASDLHVSWVVSTVVGVGIGGAQGHAVDAYVDGESVTERAEQRLVVIDAGAMVVRRQLWMRSLIEVKPNMFGPYLYAGENGNVATPVLVGTQLAGGIGWYKSAVGASLGVDFPGRVPVRGTVRFGRKITAEMRFGANFVTDRPVEPAGEMVVGTSLFAWRL